MTSAQTAISILLLATLVLFAWGRLRYDLVAFLAMLAAVFLDLVPPAEAFLGFSHPAVITVVAVLIISRALALSGAIDFVAQHLVPTAGPAAAQIGVLCGLVAVLSSVMNNVGALALLMPVAIAASIKAGRSPAAVLMPLSFASMLGGLVTLIGTPPNVIISTYRQELTGAPFAMFDFAPVGGLVAVIGVLFVALIGWRMIPRRGTTGTEELFGIEEYMTEARVPDGGKIVGKTFAEIEEMLKEHDGEILGLIRDRHQIPATAVWEHIHADDILILEAAPDGIQKIVDLLGVDLVGTEEPISDALKSDDMSLTEAVVMPRSLIEGLTAAELRLRSRYSLNLLAVARQGTRYLGRLKTFRFQGGDILLLQGSTGQIGQALSTLGCLPLAERKLTIGRSRRAIMTVVIAFAAVLATAFSFSSVPIALGAAVAAMLLVGSLNMREAYESIDWSVVVLLGAMLPVGAALETTGTTRLIAELLLAAGASASPAVILTLLIVVTMAISAIVSNAATALMMAPLAASIARGLDANPDAFLMAVAVGASCAFLTPIGHQNNTLVMGPGGYRFWDYWRMGLPLEAIVIVAAVPLILWFWPL
ncbi:MAG: SLC13 family permease [Rhodospirillales bacterium]|nr:SLC13 family permease [Rhodospirillales bacterium]